MEGGERALHLEARQSVPRRSASRLLSLLGGLFLLGSAAYAAYALLNAWLTGQERYLVAGDTALLVIGEADHTLQQASIPQVGPFDSSASGDPQEAAHAPLDDSSAAIVDGGTQPRRIAAVPSQSQASPTPEPKPVNAPAPAESPTSQPAPTPPAAVRIRIPAIGVDRSIVELPLAYDSRSKTWKRDLTRLFRRSGKDLVGHWGGSASPGQPGNTILVGHNYGYGYNGAFLRLGRLKAGQSVEVVNAAGQTFTYQVREVKHVRWSKKNQQELLQHLAYLSVEGPERLTLVTCGGSNWEPFPERVYVVADPAP